MSNTAQYTAHEATYRARLEHQNGSAGWFQMCLRFVRTMAGIPALHSSAIKAWHAATKKHTSGLAPKGSAVFWSIGEFGHVALSDGGGYCWSNDILRRGKIDRVPISSITAKWGARYLGWTEDVNGFALQIAPINYLSVREVTHAATHATLLNGSDARIRLIRASLRSLGCGNDKTDDFRDMWKAWQGRMGYRGADADGIPGTDSIAALAAECGYTVIP